MRLFQENIVKSINLQDSTIVDSNDNILPFTPKNIYLVPTSNGNHDRYVVDESGVISKQNGADEAGFIPISGTLPNNNITGVLISQSSTFFDTDWGYLQAGDRATLGRISGFVQTKGGYNLTLKPSLMKIHNENIPANYIEIDPNQGINAGRFYPLGGDYQYVQYYTLRNMYYNQDEVDALLIDRRFIEDETNVTQSMITNNGTSVTVILTENIDESLERTVYYNGVMIPRSISVVNSNNDIIINLLPLNLEPNVGDFITIKYYKKSV